MWPAWGCCSPTSTGNDLLLPSGLLLLESRSSRLDKGALNVSCNLRSENGPGVQGPRNGLLPRLKHLIQLPAGLRIDQGVGIHEGLIHIATQEKSVGSAYILDNRIDYIQRGQLLSRRSLQSTIRSRSSKWLQTTMVQATKVEDMGRECITYRTDVILQHPGDGHCMLGILFRNDSQVANLKPVIRG